MFPIVFVAAIESFQNAFSARTPSADSDTAMVVWLMFFGFLLSSIAALWLAWILYQDNKQHGPAARRLGRRLGLRRRELHMLHVVAEHAELPSAACLLISRGCFDVAAEHVSISHEQRRFLHAIRRRLFGDDVGAGAWVREAEFKALHDEDHHDLDSPERRYRWSA